MESSWLCPILIFVFFYTVIITTEGACPTNPKIPAVDLCSLGDFNGKIAYIDSSLMANEQRNCTCRISSESWQSLTFVSIIVNQTVNCDYYTYSLSNTLKPTVYTWNCNRNDSLVVPNGYIKPNKPWQISLEKTTSGLSSEGPDPEFCLLVFGYWPVNIECHGFPQHSTTPPTTQTPTTTSTTEIPTMKGTCPRGDIPVVDLCSLGAFNGSGTTYLDSSLMANDQRNCTCRIYSETSQTLTFSSFRGNQTPNCDYYTYSVLNSHTQTVTTWDCKRLDGIIASDGIARNFPWEVSLVTTPLGLNSTDGQAPAFCLSIHVFQPIRIECEYTPSTVSPSSTPQTSATSTTVASTSPTTSTPTTPTSPTTTTMTTSPTTTTMTITTTTTTITTTTTQPTTTTTRPSTSTATPASTTTTSTDTTTTRMTKSITKADSARTSTTTTSTITSTLAGTANLNVATDRIDTGYTVRVGVIAVGTIAALLLCCTVGAGLIFCRRRNKKTTETDKADDADDADDAMSNVTTATTSYAWPYRRPVYFLNTGAVGDMDSARYW